VSADTAVRLDGVTYRFGEHRAVDGLDLAVRRGETFGLLGRTAQARRPPSGCSTRCFPFRKA
jgi:ABC-2 type transport system ATP-binding protein